MRWMWIDRIAVLDKAERCVAIKNVSLAEEHLHDHFPRCPVMPATLMIEGMAQTAGILVGHARQFAEKVILAKVGRATFEADVYPGQTLIYEATLDHIDDAGAATSGVVSMLDHASGDSKAQPRAIGRIDLLFSHIDQNMAGLEFPEDNFVFTEQFFDLIRRSGVG
jgi:3-hydroxyacyl-[acyl-carrier-protein] dehydratase